MVKLVRPQLAFAVFPFVFFAALLFSRVVQPGAIYFDETHYIPAAKELLNFNDNLNWVHPPFGKLLMGLGWLIFTKWLHLIGEPTVFRCVAALFGLWTLAAIRAWMKELGYGERAAAAAVWLTGFNFLWFVQSKIGMLDIFYVAFALWGLLEIWRARGAGYWRGWVFLGLAASCKWAAAPFVLMAFFFERRALYERAIGVLVLAATYAVTFLPLAFLSHNPVHIQDLIGYHQMMLSGFDSIASAPHPYESHWWDWPTLKRPMWYLFDGGVANGITVERCVWAGGNPVLFWVALPFLFVVAHFGIKRGDRAARMLAALYWVPFLFWVAAPRKLQLYYYYLAPSLIIGPIVVWAHERFLGPSRKLGLQTHGWVLIGFVLLCATAFFYFLPIMDARPLPHDEFRRWMWFTSWI